MRKLFSMLLILGICASFGALAHGPPGHTDKVHKIEKKNFEVNQAVTLEKYFEADVAAAETENQALPSRHDIELEEVAEDVSFAMVSSDRETGRPPTTSAHWRVDRSRFRWCSLEQV